MKPASKLPWEATRAAYEIGAWAIATPQRYLATVNNETGNAETDARYIVHACNLYPELVEALRDCANIHDTADAGKRAAIILNARAILDKCKGE